MRIETKRGSLPIRYDWNALRLIGDELGLSMNDMLSFDLMNRKIGDTFVFVYYGFLRGAKFNDEECKVKDIDDVGDLLDEDADILAKAIQCFADDMSAKKEGEETDKKK